MIIIIKTAGPLWTRKAKDRKEWGNLKEAYVERQAEKKKEQDARNNENF